MDVEANYSRRLIDPSEIFSDRYKLMAAVAVIDVSNNKVPIWEINFTDKIKDIRLHKNSFIAECKEINEVGDSVFLSSALDLSLSSTRHEGYSEVFR